MMHLILSAGGMLMEQQYGEELKKAVREHINSGRISEAKELLSIYGAPLKSDPEGYIIQADIAIREKNMGYAIDALQQGLCISGENYSILYKLASLLKSIKRTEGALYYYWKAKKWAEKQEQRDEIKQSVEEIENSIKDDCQERAVSIILFADRGIGCTVQCIDSLYRYTSHLDFELITVDRGTADGTKEFLNSLPNSLKMRMDSSYSMVKTIAGCIEAAHGRYISVLHDDLILTESWADNLIKCIESDDSIGLVAPVCGVSGPNKPTESGNKDTADMQEFAKRYNVYDPNKWEEKIELKSYCMISKKEMLKKVLADCGILDSGLFFDNDISFGIRRSGYRLISAGDTFVYRQEPKAGNEVNNAQLIERDRRIFSWKYGVDPWNDTAISYDLVNAVDYQRQGQIKILGINPMCGDTLLQIKNKFYSLGQRSISLYGFTEDKKYNDDLKTICSFVGSGGIDNLKCIFEREYFDIIIVENAMEQYDDCYRLLKDIGQLLKNDGQVIVCFGNSSYYANILSLINNVDIEQKGRFLSKKKLLNDIKCAGYEEVNVSGLKASIPDEHAILYKNLIESPLILNKNNQDILCISRFVFSLKGRTGLKNVLLYPGYDMWLDDRAFIDKNGGSLSGIEKESMRFVILRDVFREKGYNLMTIDRGHIEDAEYIIFEDMPKRPDNAFFRDCYQSVYKGREYYDQCIEMGMQDRMVLILRETPLVIPDNYNRSLHDCFSLIFTWDDSLVDNKKYFKYNCPQPSGIARNFARGFKSRKLCTMVNSNIPALGEGELYSQRINIIKYFEDRHPDKFDLYGRGWDKKQFKCYRGNVDNKAEILGKYRFCIAYEDSCNLKGNITGRLFDCFLSGCVPIYLGAPNVLDYIPENTFIDNRRFQSYDELYEFINSMGEERYSRYIENINKFLHSHKYYRFTDIYYAENIANILQQRSIRLM